MKKKAESRDARDTSCVQTYPEWQATKTRINEKKANDL